MSAIAIVVNPTKFDDLDAVKREAGEVADRLGAGKIRWLETTEDDPGHGQAAQAITEGAELVCPLGGDGTVRAVGSALVGTGVPLGLLPGGTGNLLARNLDLPIDSIPDALELAITGADRAIDVGRVSFDGGDEEVFLVMCGMGLDAETVDADEGLKARVGVLAYAASGVRSLLKPGFGVRVSSVADELRRRRARMVVVGNCGELTGGVALLPDAVLDDGRLDAAVVAPHGVVGWVAVLADVVTRHRRGHARLQTLSGERFDVRTKEPVASEIDGDVVGEHSHLAARVDPGALIVRVARSG